MGRHRLHAAPRRGVRRTAVRTGLLGVSVAVVLGTAAVTTGYVPVGGSFPYLGTGSSDRTEARAKPTPTPNRGLEQGGLANLSGRASTGPAAGTASALSACPPRKSPASNSPS
ncbi:SCP-like extracellular, partial [Streptomyces sp. RSD-27]